MKNALKLFFGGFNAGKHYIEMKVGTETSSTLIFSVRPFFDQDFNLRKKIPLPFADNPA